MAASRGNSNRQLYTGNTNQNPSSIPPQPVFSTPNQLEQSEPSMSSNHETPSQDSAESTATTSNQMEALVQRYIYHQELDKAHEQMKREEHEKRIKSLRKELDWIASSQWMYTPIDKLIGQ